MILPAEQSVLLNLTADQLPVGPLTANADMQFHGDLRSSVCKLHVLNGIRTLTVNESAQPLASHALMCVFVGVHTWYKAERMNENEI